MRSLSSTCRWRGGKRQHAGWCNIIRRAPRPPLPPRPNVPRPANQGGRGPMEALEKKCRGVIFCYTDISDEAGPLQLPAVLRQASLHPALSGSAKDGERLSQSPSPASATATVRCDAKLTPEARAGHHRRDAERRDRRSHLHDHAHRWPQRGERRRRARTARGGDLSGQGPELANAQSCSRRRRGTMRAAPWPTRSRVQAGAPGGRRHCEM